MNPKQLINLKNRLPLLKADHGDLAAWFKGPGQQSMQAGTKVQILFTHPDGSQQDCSLTLTENDMETLRQIKETFAKKK